MSIRAYTWAEFNAWMQVTDRAERRDRAARLIDSFHAARGEIDALNKLVEKLDG